MDSHRGHLQSGRLRPPSTPTPPEELTAIADKPVRVVIDCDTGIDDAQAIVYSLLSPDTEVVGLTTVWGNAPVEHTTNNTLRLLELVDQPDIPVARGAGKPLLGPAHHMAVHVHGDDGIGNLNQRERSGLS